jgi:TonB-dependent SusC/RagA subfamily outer membrane receptor
MDGNLVRKAALRLTTVAALSLLLGAPAAAQQQATGTIRGQATDAVTMRPLSGVQISVPGTGRGALANASGQFLVLNVPTGTFTVKAEIIGYATQEQQISVVAGQVAQVEFRLSQTALELDAIVVTGTPGQTQKRALGNSVSQLDATSVTESVPIQNVQELLQGRTPGLTLLSDGGGAGDGQQIRLRGSGSLEGRYEPVVFIDGVRIESGQQDGMCGSTMHCTSALESINPNDIESIEVIKGPAASTLYGAEAASGVIQIITKKGRSGAGVQWSGSLDAGTSDWAVARPVTYWQCTASNTTSSSYPGCAGVAPGTVKVYHPLDENPGAMRGNAGSADPNGPGQWGVNLSARGGGDLFNFFISADKSDEQGIFHNNFSQRTGRACELRVHAVGEDELRRERGLFPHPRAHAAVEQLVELDPAQRLPWPRRRQLSVRDRVSELRTRVGEPVEHPEPRRAVHHRRDDELQPVPVVLESSGVGSGQPEPPDHRLQHDRSDRQRAVRHHAGERVHRP